MKINEYNQMMNYLTRPGKVLQNNINDKKFNAIEARTALKRGGSDTKPTPKNNKMLEYIDDINIIYGDKKATNAEKDAAANRQKLREATPEQLGKLQKRLDNARAFVTPPKRRDTWKEFVASGGKELPKLSPEEIKKVQGDRKVRDYMLRNYRAEKPKPIKPDLVNGHSDWNTDDWLQIIDPGGWSSDEDKKADIENIRENLFEDYLDLLKKGDLLPGTTFEMFEKNFMNYDTDVFTKIKKRVRDMKKAEGIATLLGVSSGRNI